MVKANIDQKILVFYDSECGFCQRWIQKLNQWDTKDRILFAPLFGDSFAEYISMETFENMGAPDSILVYAEGKIYAKSKAVIYLLNLFPAWNPWVRILKLLPKSILDMLYDRIALHRKKWKTHCDLPSKSLQSKLLS